MKTSGGVTIMYGVSIGLQPQSSAKLIAKIKPEEYNYLLNPTHPDFEKITIGASTKYRFDPRLAK